jgi:hypothetical protein
MPMIPLKANAWAGSLEAALNPAAFFTDAAFSLSNYYIKQGAEKKANKRAAQSWAQERRREISAETSAIAGSLASSMAARGLLPGSSLEKLGAASRVASLQTELAQKEVQKENRSFYEKSKKYRQPIEEIKKKIGLLETGIRSWI